MKPKVLIYCQHSLGMGHLVRSFALADALARDGFGVTFLNGGRFPKGIKAPLGVGVVNLPPVGMDAAAQLVSLDRRRSVERAIDVRRARILSSFEATKPDLVLVELFPFGRKKFAGEILPLLAAAKESGAKVVCSLRDILVRGRRDQERFEEKALALANEWFDALLVHSDEDFIRLEASFPPAARLRMPVHYTGFVVPDGAATVPADAREPRRGPRKVIVSAGGGIVGEGLLDAAAGAHRILSREFEIETELVTGVFLAPEKAARLRATANATPGLKVTRFVSPLRDALARADVSVSQCGYNTAFDIMLSGVAAVVVPFAANAEDEQTVRARKLADLGLLRVAATTSPGAEELADEIRRTLGFVPSGRLPRIDGGARSAGILRGMLAPKSPAVKAAAAAADWLAPVRRALESANEEIGIFFRDDDAGVGDARLFALLDLFEEIGLPLDLAVIPKAVTPRFTARLLKRIESAGVAFGLHQHGYAHVNHEREGRKCEFGPSRPAARQLADIADGRRILVDQFGERLQPVFTPPWNRCTNDTAGALAALGFRVLSREDRAERLLLRGDLREVPVAIDWFAKRRGVRLGREAVGESIAARIEAGREFGIMLHHEVTDAAERRAFGELGRLLAASGRVRFKPLAAAAPVF